MTTSVVYQLGAMVSAFLVGANIAFLLHLGARLVLWFNLKVAAATILLVYIGASLEYSHPALWRALLGLTALVLDTVALGWMWRTIVHTADSGLRGLVPLWPDKEPKKPADASV